LLTVAFDVIGTILVLLGIWDWVEAVQDDATTAHRRLALRRELAKLELDLAAASVELRRRLYEAP